MARERSPSDERRARPFVRVHLTIRNHPTYGEVFDDPELRGMWLGVLVVARGAHAGKTGNVVSLSVGDILWITGRQGIRDGLPALRRLCTAMRWELDGAGPAHRRGRDGKLTGHRRHNVKVRNYERKQGLRSAKTRPPIPSTDTESDTEDAPKKERKRAPSDDAVKFAEDFRHALERTGTLRRKLTESAFHRWTVEADRMLRRDGIKLEEARELCAWIFRSEDEEARFWRATARSVPNFRRNYDQINAQRERAEGGRDARGEGARAAARIARRRGLDTGGDGGPVVDVRRDAGRLPAPEEPGGGDDT